MPTDVPPTPVEPVTPMSEASPPALVVLPIDELVAQPPQSFVVAEATSTGLDAPAVAPLVLPPITEASPPLLVVLPTVAADAQPKQS